MNAEVIALANASNGGKQTVEFSVPYTAHVTIQGSAAIIFHRWNSDSVDAKAKAAKNSKAKKEDDVESYVYRDDEGFICLPGEYLRQAVIHAAKFRQDPRSPRKSAMDLFKAGVVATTELASLGSKEWDYLDRRRVCVQRAGVTRVRPAFSAGWKASVDLLVLTPEYISPDDLRATVESAGRLVGLADYRPTYGRFGIVGFEVMAEQIAA